jgi:hypothetical protein
MRPSTFHAEVEGVSMFYGGPAAPREVERRSDGTVRSVTWQLGRSYVGLRARVTFARDGRTPVSETITDPLHGVVQHTQFARDGETLSSVTRTNVRTGESATNRYRGGVRVLRSTRAPSGHITRVAYANASLRSMVRTTEIDRHPGGVTSRVVRTPIVGNDDGTYTGGTVVSASVRDHATGTVAHVQADPATGRLRSVNLLRRPGAPRLSNTQRIGHVTGLLNRGGIRLQLGARDRVNLRSTGVPIR